MPALWDLLRRRLFQRFDDKSPRPRAASCAALASANYELRSRTGLDLGMLLFLPVHEGFGGRIRYLISGGSALPPDVHAARSHGMGFNFFEGYGLTETAPVLTVTSPKQKPIVGSVGQPLPGIEVKIDEPDATTGVGEVIARGRNVMAGYWQDPDATAMAMRDGWFHTGDLGRFDDDGNLYLVGRSKDVIVDANGKNVYPDEIEDLYRESPFIKELSVVGIADGIGEQVACAVVADLERDKELSRRRRPQARRGALRARCRPICRCGSGCGCCTSGTAICPRPPSVRSSAATSPPRSRASAARTRRPRARWRWRRARAARSPGCWTRSRRCRAGGASRCSSAAGSASWASTA